MSGIAAHTKWFRHAIRELPRILQRGIDLGGEYVGLGIV
jgi:hypothetical protein